MATTIDEAFDQTFSEMGFDTPSDTPEGTADEVEPDPEEATPPAEVTEDESEESVPEGETPDGDDELEPEDEDESEDDASPPVIEVAEGAVIRLPDGTEVPVEKAVLFQADYTKKTQALADERNSFEAEKAEYDEKLDKVVSWYEDRRSKPTEWVEEIVLETEDPTLTIVKAIKGLHDHPDGSKLDPRFAAMLGLDEPDGEVSAQARKAREDDRIAALERRIQEQDEAASSQARQAEVVAEFERQYDSIKSDYGMSFDSPSDELAFRTDLVVYARDNRIPNLRTAYAAMQFERQGATQAPSPAEPTASAPEPDPEVQARKRANRAVAAKSTSSNRAPAPKRYADTLDAAVSTVDDFLAGR